MSPSPALSILVVTQAEPHTWSFLRAIDTRLAALNAELVVAVDCPIRGFMPGELLSGDWHRLNWVQVQSRGYIESVLDQALMSCTGEYVLRLDDDEALTPTAWDFLAEEGYRAHPHWKFDRYNLWGDVRHYIPTPPLFPDHQTRLSKRELAGGRCVIHCGSPFGGGEVAPGGILHHRFLIRPYEQRAAIAAKYDGVSPGAGTSPGMLPFNLPEDVWATIELREVPE